MKERPQEAVGHSIVHHPHGFYACSIACMTPEFCSSELIFVLVFMLQYPIIVFFINSSVYVNPLNCLSCHLGNQTHLSFTKSFLFAPLDFVHSYF
jgi:hypothetical protein